MARDGMTSLIQRLRGQAAVGTADFTVAGSAYWSDDHLQEELDRQRTLFNHVPLYAVPMEIPSDVLYFQYLIPSFTGRSFEEASGGTTVWRIYDSTGATIGTADYTVDYGAGAVYFTADTGGEARYLDCRTYNVNRAAANVWYWKAAHVADQVNWQTDNHKVEASQRSGHYLKMAESFERTAGNLYAVTLKRDDLY